MTPETIIEKASVYRLVDHAGEVNLGEEISRLRDALHHAIASPRGRVPVSAVKYYNPDHPALWRINEGSQS